HNPLRGRRAGRRRVPRARRAHAGSRDLRAGPAGRRRAHPAPRLVSGPAIGVLAIQGDFEAHAKVLERLGARARDVRTREDLEGLDGLVIPGGESTTMTLGIDREGLAEPLRDLIRPGTPTLGTCAGLIMPDQERLRLLDLTARRNAFGRQSQSFEADLELNGFGPVRAVFIRAPWVEEHDPE